MHMDSLQAAAPGCSATPQLKRPWMRHAQCSSALLGKHNMVEHIIVNIYRSGGAIGNLKTMAAHDQRFPMLGSL